MPLASYALSDAFTVQQYVGTDRLPVEKIEILINAVSEVILDDTGREFTPPVSPDADVERIFAYDASSGLLSIPDLRTLTSIKLYTDRATASWRTLAAQTAAAAAEYNLWPLSKTREGTWLAVDLPRGAARPAYSPNLTQVTIAGRWGTLTVPAAAEAALLVTIDDLLSNPEGSRQLPDGGIEAFVVNTGTDVLPPQADGFLRRLRRQNII